MADSSRFRIAVLAGSELVSAVEQCARDTQSVDGIDGSVELDIPNDDEDAVDVVAEGDYEALAVEGDHLDDDRLDTVFDRASDVPILALSRSDSQEQALETERRGAHGSLLADSPSQREFELALRTAVRRHRLAQARDRQREQATLLERLLSVDVRNDMRYALDWGDSALETVEEPAVDHLERMLTVCHHSKNLADSVETIRALITDGDLIDELPAVDLRRLIQNEIQRLHQDDTGATFQLAAGFDEDVMVRGDELLGCALYTLLADAIDRSPEGTDVQVSIRTTDDDVIVSVRDEGSNPPAAKVDQLSSERTAPDDPVDDRVGSYFANRIIEGYGGELAVQTETDETTIQVTLPKTGSLQADFQVDTELSERPDSDRFSARISMSETELVFETDETTHRIDHDRIFDIANDVGRYDDPGERASMTIAYRKGQTTETAALHGKAGTLVKFQRLLFRNLLDGTPVTINYSRREASGSARGEVKLKITADRILFRAADGTASVKRDSIKHFNMREQSAGDSGRQVITINHLEDGVPAKTDIAFGNNRMLNLFGRFLQTNVDTGAIGGRRAAQTVRVLLVEDDPADREMASLMLKERADELAIETASNAAEAYTLIQSNEFDCVISDYDMPNNDGIDLLQQVRQTHPDLPFILFTGQGSEEVAKEAILSDVTDYVQKGIGADQYDILFDRLRRAVH